MVAKGFYVNPLILLSLALEYAVNVLKIRHLVVMGHGGCGGISAALAETIDERCCEFVGPWVNAAHKSTERETFRLHRRIFF